MKYFTEPELEHQYAGKIKFPAFVYINAVETSNGVKVAAGDLVRVEQWCWPNLLYVDSITYEPWNKVEFWCASVDELRKPLLRFPYGLRKIWPKWILAVEIMADSLVYFIKEDSGNVKIGITKNLEKRLRTIQTHNSHKVKVLKTIPCSNINQARKIEKELHKRLSEFRLNGEWFKLPKPVLNELIAE